MSVGNNVSIKLLCLQSTIAVFVTGGVFTSLQISVPPGMRKATHILQMRPLYTGVVYPYKTTDHFIQGWSTHIRPQTTLYRGGLPI